MREIPDARLADCTTLHLGGPADRFAIAESEDELIALVDEADQAKTPVLVVGGGSNLVVGDAGFAGTVVQIGYAQAWDDFVAGSVANNLAGVEALSGIPGTQLATAIQNVGAYGQEVSQTIASVRVWDRLMRGQRTFAAKECVFGYRTSRFKQDPARHVVLEVKFDLEPSESSKPIQYDELAKVLGVAVGERAPLNDVREAVLTLRRGKGMVLDPHDHDTWSAGSFFTNPVIDASQVPEGAPSYPESGGHTKTSAAWLIEHAGFPKGYGNEFVSLSTKHTLALTNRGEGSTMELLRLAAEIVDGVDDKFGIVLQFEPVIVG